MSFLDRLTSAYRFLTQEQRAMFSPCSSERAFHQLAARMGVRLPGVTQ